VGKDFEEPSIQDQADQSAILIIIYSFGTTFAKAKRPNEIQKIGLSNGRGYPVLFP